MQNTEIMPRHETVMPPQSIFPIWIFFSNMIHNLYCVISCLYCLSRCMRLARSLPSSPHLLREISDSRAQTLVFARTKIWLENKLGFLPASSFSQDSQEIAVGRKTENHLSRMIWPTICAGLDILVLNKQGPFVNQRDRAWEYLSKMQSDPLEKSIR